jgi:hypothetical protein
MIRRSKETPQKSGEFGFFTDDEGLLYAQLRRSPAVRYVRFTSKPEIGGPFAASALSAQSQQSDLVLTLRADAPRNGDSRGGR